jgi:Zn-dependent peptidase ImmA (M78 family)
MPRNSVLALAPTFITLNSLLEMKKHWLVSVSALAYRLNTLGLLTEWQYRTLNMEISQKGWRKNEPNTIMRERSQIIDKVMALLKEQGISKSTIANELNIDVSELNQFIFGLPRLKLL